MRVCVCPGSTNLNLATTYLQNETDEGPCTAAAPTCMQTRYDTASQKTNAPRPPTEPTKRLQQRKRTSQTLGVVTMYIPASLRVKSRWRRRDRPPLPGRRGAPARPASPTARSPYTVPSAARCTLQRPARRAEVQYQRCQTSRGEQGGRRGRISSLLSF